MAQADPKQLAAEILRSDNIPADFLAYITDYVTLMGGPFTLGQVGATYLNRQLDVLGTQLDLVSSAADTTIYSKVVGANTLGVNGCLELLILGDYKNNSGSNRTFTLTVNYGGTTLYKDTSASLIATANRGPMLIDLYLIAANSVSSQILNGWLTQNDRVNAATTGLGDLATAGAIYGFSGTASADSTRNQTLEVKFQHSASDANLSFRRNYVILRKIGH